MLGPAALPRADLSALRLRGDRRSRFTNSLLSLLRHELNDGGVNSAEDSGTASEHSAAQWQSRVLWRLAGCLTLLTVTT